MPLTLLIILTNGPKWRTDASSTSSSRSHLVVSLLLAHVVRREETREFDNESCCRAYRDIRLNEVMPRTRGKKEDSNGEKT
ncbi:hypothetical protein TNCV_3626251 [Trichonephila clavipes]|nr:hypothetical protein TNCV_3626251 [Trichonephila clavipes]